MRRGWPPRSSPRTGDLPFDIAQLRTIFFNPTDLASANECTDAIVAQLRAALESGGYSPVTTAVDLAALDRRHGGADARRAGRLVRGPGKDSRAALAE
jgi:hypothetical protein